MVDDPGASPAERQTARRLLCELDARVSRDTTRVLLSLHSAWEIALLKEISDRREVTVERDGSSMVVRGGHEAVESTLVDFVGLRPQLEHVVSVAAAGWIASRFPRVGTGEATGLGNADALLARSAAQVKDVDPLRRRELLEGPGRLRLLSGGSTLVRE